MLPSHSVHVNGILTARVLTVTQVRDQSMLKYSLERLKLTDIKLLKLNKQHDSVLYAKFDGDALLITLRI